MDLNEYREKIKLIAEQAERAKRLAAREYALSNNAVALGDLIEDHIGKIKVEKIDVYYSDPPQCVYFGIECKKDGAVTKRGKTRAVYQTNIKT